MQVVEAVDSDKFWSQLQGLCTLLTPFATAMAAVQSKTASLADVTLHLLQLAKALENAKTEEVLPAGECNTQCLAITSAWAHWQSSSLLHVAASH